MKQTQPFRVLLALKEGCRTAREIADFANFSESDGRGGAKTAAAYLYELCKNGCIEKTGKVKFSERSPSAFTYRLLPRGEAELRRRQSAGGKVR